MKRRYEFKINKTITVPVAFAANSAYLSPMETFHLGEVECNAV